jgi:putative flippase GtrA
VATGAVSMAPDSLLRAGTSRDCPAQPARDVLVEIVIPVRNEERDLGPSVRRLHAYLCERFPFAARITIADNGSDDGTWAVATALEAEFSSVRAVRIRRPGRGGALRSVWLASDADIVAYMDVDLSTDLNALLPLVAPLVSGHSDVAIGTRLARGARVVRGPRREIISRCYNLLLHATLRTRFSDAQCGFKAVRADQAQALLPLTSDTAWFFDTELLVLAQRAGLRIHEIPVDWVDDPDSRVHVLSTALADVRGIVRLGTALARGTIAVPVLRGSSPPGATAGEPAGRGLLMSQLARFAVIGVASTVAYLLLYLLLRDVLAAQPANAISLLVTAVANTTANRRLTFGIRGRTRAARHQVLGLVAFAVSLALSSGALDALHIFFPHAGRAVEVAALVVANVTATIVRFGLYRGWVFRGQPNGQERNAQ